MTNGGLMNKYCLIFCFLSVPSLMAMHPGRRMLYAPGTQPKTDVERLCVATAGSCISGVVAACGLCQANPCCLYAGLGTMFASQVGGGWSFFCISQKKEDHRDSEPDYPQRSMTHFSVPGIVQQIRPLPRACLQHTVAHQEPFMPLPSAIY